MQPISSRALPAAAAAAWLSARGSDGARAAGAAASAPPVLPAEPGARPRAVPVPMSSAYALVPCVGAARDESGSSEVLVRRSDEDGAGVALLASWLPFLANVDAALAVLPLVSCTWKMRSCDALRDSACTGHHAVYC